jgi:hypothetical protein
MSQKLRYLIILLLGLSLMACALVTTPEAVSHTPVTTSAPTLPPAPTTAVPPTPTLLASTALPATATSAPTNTPASTPTTVVVAPVVSGLSANLYTDDRSAPASLIISLFNAVNRHEYLRAYSYWQNPSATLGTLASYSSGYANTASVDLVFGKITGDAGAGQLYYTVPVIIKGTATNGVKANFAACYVTHMSQPGFQAAPPYIGMMILRGKSHAVDVNASDDTNLAGACSGADYPTGSPLTPLQSASIADISKNNYIDNRSGPIEVVSSLENALNRKEYVRAYSYWQNPSASVGPFTAYSTGFSDTNEINVAFGSSTSNAGAGQIQYKVPLSIKVKTTTGSTQTFVGCYTLHLSQPGIQATLPFEPLGIIAGKFKLVDNSIDTTPMLAAACN